MSDVFQIEGSYTLVDKVTTNLKKVSSEVDKAGNTMKKSEGKMVSFGKTMDKIGGSMQKFGGNATKFMTLPLVGAGAASFSLASDMQESIGKIDVAFKQNADEVVAWGDTTLKKFGIAKGSALDMASTFGEVA